jgi:pimeloyl-ACP methyl ester carboxylesterase
MTFPLWIAAAVGLILGAAVFAVDRMALKMIRPPKKRLGRSVENLPFVVRSHPFTSLGQDLQGWLVEPETDGGMGVVVMVHGWGSSHARMLPLAEPLLKAGHPVFLFDVRYHGLAPEAPYVTARHFRDDTRAAIQEVAQLYPERPRILIGHSMGGSAGVLAAAEGARIQGLVSIAAPADLWGVWAEHFNAKGLPGKWIVRLMNPFWRIRAGVPFRTLDPELRARELRVPFLILHGDQDQSVDVSHARLLAAAAQVEPVILRGEDHNDLLGRPALVKEVLGFLYGVGG